MNNVKWIPVEEGNLVMRKNYLVTIEDNGKRLVTIGSCDSVIGDKTEWTHGEMMVAYAEFPEPYVNKMSNNLNGF